MGAYEKEIIKYFFEHQTQLFPENVAETPEEAEEFLEDSMAVVCKNIREVREYFDESGIDIFGMSDSELKQAEEVFELPDGRYLVIS